LLYIQTVKIFLQL